MIVIDEIAYPDNKETLVKVVGVKPLDDYKLWVRFNTDETKIFDFKPLLDEICFLPLKDKNIFNSVYIDYGIVTWNDGEIDIATEKVYADGFVETTV